MRTDHESFDRRRPSAVLLAVGGVRMGLGASSAWVSMSGSSDPRSREAGPHFLAAVALRPRSGYSHLLLAQAMLGQGKHDLRGGGTYLSQPDFFNGHALVPLGTFGGPTGFATGINNNGDVIGAADNTSGASVGFVSHNGGPLVSLGTLPGRIADDADRDQR